MKTKLINYNKANICSFDGFRLIPGVNRISEEQWKQVQLLQAEKIKLGVITDISPKSSAVEDEPKRGRGRHKKEEPKPSHELASFDMYQAIAVIKETVDKQLLEEWLQLETRKTVKLIISEQLEKLALPPPEKEDA